MSIGQSLLLILTRRERLRAAGLVAFALAGALAETLGIGALFPFLNLLASPQLLETEPRLRALYGLSGAASAEAFMAMAAGALLLLFAFKNLLLCLNYFLQTRFVFALEHRLATDLLKAFVQAPYAQRVERNSADQLQLITGEVPRLTSSFLLPLLSLLSETLVVLGILLLLLVSQPLAAAIALALIGVTGATVSRVLRRSLAGAHDERAQAHQRMFRWSQQSLGSAREAKVLGRESYFIGHFSDSSRSYADVTRRYVFLNQLPRLAVETVVVATLLGAVVTLAGSGRALGAAIPVLLLFGLASVRLMPSATRIVSSINSLRFFAPSVRAVAAALATIGGALAETAAAVASGGARPRFEELALSGIHFRYPGSAHDVIVNLDLRLGRGDAVAVVGRSGAGKTTLGDLLLGLLEPQQGAMRVNGAKVGSLMAEWPRLAGLVPQSPYFLDDTVRRNVAFGVPDPEIDDHAVWRALRDAQLEERIRQMPGALETHIGEHGQALSGGERQRLSIARALYADPDVLVLDEATSALDAATEAEVIQALRPLVGVKTLVVITHRVAAIGLCTRVALMKEGRIDSVAAADAAGGDPKFTHLIRE